MNIIREIIVSKIDIERNQVVLTTGEVRAIEPEKSYLIANEDGTHEKYVTDSGGTISKQGKDLKNYVTLNTPEEITASKNFTEGFNINSFIYKTTDFNNMVIAGGKNVFGTKSNIDNAAIAVGNNLFPSMNLQPFDPVTETWNNKGYIGVGSDIFINYTGDTNYRPSHNAHDSWIGLGRGLGAGFLDGTNVTMIGTANMHRNDVKYADSITILGKGFTNGRKTRGTKTLDPNRVVPSKNGYNVHGIMSDVIGIGHENWIEDINQSVVVGSNLRPYSYVFNSLVLGHHHFNMNFEGTTEQADMYLDSDVIIGMGVGKRSSRHAPSHNLLVGMDYTYVTGTPPDPTYRPLIEGNFKKEKASLQVNGKLIAGHANENEDIPEYEEVKMLPLSSVTGVTFSESKITVGPGAPSSGSLAFTPLVKNNDLVYNTKMKPIAVTAGSYGGKLSTYIDSGNNNTSFTWNQSFQVLTTSPDANTEVIFTWADGFQGVIELTIKSIDIVNNTGVKPVLAFKSGAEEVTFEARSGSNPTKHLAFGKDTGKMLFLGATSNFFGTNTYTKAVSASQTVMLGSNIATNVVDSNRTTIVGSNILTTTTKIPSLSVLIGNNILNNADVERPLSAVVIGADTCINTKKVDESVIIGRTVLINQRESTRDVIIGSISSFFNTTTDCTIVGARSFTDGRYNSVDARNLTTLGARDFVSPVGYNNITVIGNNETTNTFLHGKVNLRERLKVQSYSKEQRNALPNKEVGDLIYQTDAGNAGLRVFDGTNWLAIPTIVD